MDHIFLLFLNILTIVEICSNVNASYYIQTDEGANRFFQYSTVTNKTTDQFRRETILPGGGVKGVYSWRDGDGRTWLYTYVADDKGYRVKSHIQDDVNMDVRERRGMMGLYDPRKIHYMDTKTKNKVERKKFQKVFSKSIPYQENPKSLVKIKNGVRLIGDAGLIFVNHTRNNKGQKQTHSEKDRPIIQNNIIIKTKQIIDDRQRMTENKNKPWIYKEDQEIINNYIVANKEKVLPSKVLMKKVRANNIDLNLKDSQQPFPTKDTLKNKTSSKRKKKMKVVRKIRKVGRGHINLQK